MLLDNIIKVVTKPTNTHIHTQQWQERQEKVHYKIPAVSSSHTAV